MWELVVVMAALEQVGDVLSRLGFRAVVLICSLLPLNWATFVGAQEERRGSVVLPGSDLPYSDTFFGVVGILILLGLGTCLGLLFGWRARRETEVAQRQAQSKADETFEVLGRLRLNERRLQLATKQLFIWDWNIETDELYASSSFREALGYTEEEFEVAKSGSTVNLLHPDDRDHYLKRLHEHLENPEGDFVSEHRFRTKAGDYRWFLAFGQSEVNSDGQAVRFTGASTDITERKALQVQLLQAQKMEVVGNIAGGIAHDFNNLLSIVLGNLELVKSAETLVDAEPFIEDAIASSRSGVRLTRNMLDFARQATPKTGALNLEAVVSETTGWVGRGLPGNIRITTSVPDDLAWIEADPAFAQSALLNLVLNSRDAMPSGGEILVEAKNRLVDTDYRDVFGDVILAGRYVELAVSDSGAGIPAQEQKEIFEPFFTTKPQGKGTGLGLAMVHGFMKQIGGTVSVHSVSGEGARFSLLFPVAGEQERGVEQDQADAGGRLEVGRGRVLLVEDDPQVLKMLAAMLSKRGYQVTTARSGDAAWRGWTGDVDILVTDVRMPGKIQGNDLARKVRDHDVGMPILLLTGYSFDPEAWRDIPGRSPIHLTKPVPSALLFKTMAELMRADVP